MSKELVKEGHGDYLTQQIINSKSLAKGKQTNIIKEYIEVTKVGIIRSNFLTVITGMWLAAGGSFANLSLLTVILTAVGSTAILASATTLNNYIDRDIDQKMERTQTRALVEGRLAPLNVLIYGIILGIVGTVALLFVNLLTVLVAWIGLISYVGLYSLWTKRSHSLNTIVGSIPGAVPPVMGWVSVTGTMDPGAWILFVILFLWQPPHFLALAMRRCEEYRAAGIPMLPVVNGFPETKRQIVRYIAALVPASLSLFLVTDIGWGYVWLTLVLGLVWLVLALRGFSAQDDIRWAKINFLYSLLYLTIMCVGMMITI